MMTETIDPDWPATWPSWLNEVADTMMAGTWLGCCAQCEDTRGGRICVSCDETIDNREYPPTGVLNRSRYLADRDDDRSAD